MSLSQVLFIARVFFSSIYIDSPALLQLLFAWYMCFFPFVFNLFVSLILRHFSCRQLYLDILYLVLKGVFFYLSALFIHIYLIWLWIQLDLSANFAFISICLFFVPLSLPSFFVKMYFLVKFWFPVDFLSYFL